MTPENGRAGSERRTLGALSLVHTLSKELSAGFVSLRRRAILSWGVPNAMLASSSGTRTGLSSVQSDRRSPHAGTVTLQFSPQVNAGVWNPRRKATSRCEESFVKNATLSGTGER